MDENPKTNKEPISQLVKCKLQQREFVLDLMVQLNSWLNVTVIDMKYTLLYFSHSCVYSYVSHSLFGLLNAQRTVCVVLSGRTASGILASTWLWSRLSGGTPSRLKEKKITNHFSFSSCIWFAYSLNFVQLSVICINSIFKQINDTICNRAVIETTRVRNHAFKQSCLCGFDIKYISNVERLVFFT